MEKVNLGDLVRVPSIDMAAFKVVGIRADELEVEGDFSGGMVPNYEATSWVPRSDCEPWHKPIVIPPSPPRPPASAAAIDEWHERMGGGSSHGG